MTATCSAARGGPSLFAAPGTCPASFALARLFGLRRTS